MKHEIIEELFKSLCKRYQEGLEESMKGSDFIFDSVDLLCHHLQKVSPKWSISYIDFPKWLKNKTATINPKNNDDKCFQNAVTVALNNEQTKSHPGGISKIWPFINQYDWKEIDFPAQQKDWKKCELNDKTIAFNILFVSCNTKKDFHRIQNITLRVKIK